MSEEQDRSDRTMDAAAALAKVFAATHGEEVEALTAFRWVLAEGDIDWGQFDALVEVEVAAESPLRRERVAVLAFLASKRPGMPIQEGLESLSDAETVELLDQMREASRDDS